MTIIIRPAQLSDAEAIASVRVLAWRAAYHGLMPESFLGRPDLVHTEAAFLQARLRDLGAGACVSVAMVDGVLRGYCAYGPSRQPAAGSVYDLYVDPTAWSQGIGRRLLTIAMEYCRAQGWSEATLFVIEGNMRARAFYERLGWRPDGHRENYQHSTILLPVLRYRIVLEGGSHDRQPGREACC